eukprot:GEMP01006635.1.p1 GENE.GEMP01006635.1~~GEMP01006635.1.p1  ORF type:complete len:606 (+),score=72.71 GEMP01006635.1:281-2098(+)
MASLTSSSSSSILPGNLGIHGQQPNSAAASSRSMSLPGSVALPPSQRGSILSTNIRSLSGQHALTAQTPTSTHYPLLNQKWVTSPQSDTFVQYGRQAGSYNSRISYRSIRTAPLLQTSPKSEFCTFEPGPRTFAMDPRFGSPISNMKYFSRGCHNRFCMPRTTVQPASQLELFASVKLTAGTSLNATMQDLKRQTLPASPKSQSSVSKIASSLSILTDASSPKNSRIIVTDVEKTNRDSSMINIPPAFSARVARALEDMGASSMGKPCRSLPGTPVSGSARCSKLQNFQGLCHETPISSINPESAMTNRRLQRSRTALLGEYSKQLTASLSILPTRSTICVPMKVDLKQAFLARKFSSSHLLAASSPRHARVTRVGSEPSMNEVLVPDEVPILLAQMNDSSQYVNEYENKLRIIRQVLNMLDNEWRSTREKIIAILGTNHIQRADKYYTKLRELQHKKEHCTRLTQRYAHLSTTIDQMNKQHVASDRELRWLEIREAKARKVSTDIEQQMRTSMDAVNKLQQELSVLGQEYPLSVKKAEGFFSQYRTYLDGRKKAMREQKDAEVKISENKELYKSAMNGLEQLSRQIHEQRGTLDAAAKPAIEAH